jgi:SAM-dependent methyltransferase
MTGEYDGRSPEGEHASMIEVRPDVTPDVVDDVRVYLPSSALNDSDAKEFIANDRFEQSVAAKPSGRLLFDDITVKSAFIRTFQEVKPVIDIRPGHRVLELGASHGWASVIVKDDCPSAHVVTSDMVPDCVRHCTHYEGALGRQVDEKWAFSARDIPFADAQFDRVFTFASFHHFGDHGDYARSMAEVARVLKPGGKLVLLYEPTSPRLLYRWAYARVNRVRADEGLDEDVLVVDRLRAIGTRLGLSMHAWPFPYYRYRDSVASTIYYFALAKLGLGALLVCTANIVFAKA